MPVVLVNKNQYNERYIINKVKIRLESPSYCTTLLPTDREIVNTKSKPN